MLRKHNIDIETLMMRHSGLASECAHMSVDAVQSAVCSGDCLNWSDAAAAYLAECSPTCVTLFEILRRIRIAFLSFHYHLCECSPYGSESSYPISWHQRKERGRPTETARASFASPFSAQTNTWKRIPCLSHLRFGAALNRAARVEHSDAQRVSGRYF